MPLKILHVIPTLEGGGAERVLVDIVCNTSKKDFEHIICVINKGGFFAPKLQDEGYSIIELNESGKRPFFSSSQKLIKAIKEHKPDIIHSWLYNANIITRIAKLRGAKGKLITSVQAPDYDSESIKAGNWSPYKVEILRRVDKITTKLTKPHFVACSHFVAESYQENLVLEPSQVSVIHNMVDPQNLACSSTEPPLIRESLNMPGDGFVYITVGRLDPPKGQFYLLNAFQKVAAQIPQACLVIIGSGPSEADYKKLAKSLKIAHRVHFLGRRKDIGACLEMADVFVFPTLFEGFGIALVEAMAKRLPSIATDLVSIREIIDDNISGLLVASKSDVEIARAMIRLYNEPELRLKLGEQGFEKAKGHFFNDVIIPQWNQLYLNISSDRE